MHLSDVIALIRELGKETNNPISKLYAGGGN